MQNFFRVQHISTKDRIVWTVPNLCIQTTGGKFVSSWSPPPLLPVGVSFGVKNFLGDSGEWGSDGLVWAQRVRQYNPIVRG